MAGHSKFKNIMHRKGAQDKKRSALFSKLSKEITVAAKMGGPDPESNARLRLAIQTAKGQSMPKSNIERAIQNSQAGDSANYEEVRYEGFGPGGVSLIVDSLTDNRNRTASDVRAAFQKNGGNLGETGCVSYQFDRVGEIIYPADVAGAETVFEAGLEAGANDVASDDETHEIYCDADALNAVREVLEEQLGEARSVRLTWKPQTLVDVVEDDARKLMNLLDVLDDNDDVQNVFGNYNVADDVMEKLGA